MPSHRICNKSNVVLQTDSRGRLSLQWYNTAYRAPVQTLTANGIWWVKRAKCREPKPPLCKGRCRGTRRRDCKCVNRSARTIPHRFAEPPLHKGAFRLAQTVRQGEGWRVGLSLKPSPAEKVPRNEADEEIILRLNARFGQRFYRIFIGMMLSSSPASGPPSPLEKANRPFATATNGTNTLILLQIQP